MFQISFGSNCFRHPGGEESIELIIASKLECADLSEFGKRSIRKMWEWERKCNYTQQSLEERYGLSVNRMAGADEIAEVVSLLQKMEGVELLDIQKEKIINAMVLFQPLWNWKIYALETKETYLYVE